MSKSYWSLIWLFYVAPKCCFWMPCPICTFFPIFFKINIVCQMKKVLLLPFVANLIIFFLVYRILTLGLGFLIIPFLPASNLFFRVGFVVAERVIYLPSIGYIILFTYGFSLLSKQAKKKVPSKQSVRLMKCFTWMIWFLTCLSFVKKILAVAVLGILLMNIMRCALRSSQWRSEEQLFRSALSVCPLNAKVSQLCTFNLFLFSL